MNRLCKAASWFCNSLAVALLVLGILAVPEGLRADGGKTCEDVCSGDPNFDQCMAACTGLQTHPCGGRDTSPITCAVAGSPCLQAMDPFCDGKDGCLGWGAAKCPCRCARRAPNDWCGCY
jgi:hypothetical protein